MPERGAGYEYDGLRSVPREPPALRRVRSATPAGQRPGLWTEVGEKEVISIRAGRLLASKVPLTLQLQASIPILFHTAGHHSLFVGP